MLDIIREDIKKDRENARAEEKSAQAEWRTYRSEYQAQKKEMNAEIKAIKKRRGAKRGLRSWSKRTRKGLKTRLDGVMAQMTDDLPLCDFTTINFDTRKKNRQIEMDGLIKAKGILHGSSA